MSYFVELSSKQYANSVTKQGFTVYHATKRLLDIGFSACALVFFLPVILLISVALIIQDGFPFVYRHRRIGLHGKEFFCLKFRTMARDADRRLMHLLATCPESRRQWEESQKLARDPRVHWLGQVLRKSSLDEIPQFLNVLRGEMSIVGPRPIVRDEISRYQEAFGYYLAMKPGITGLWQIHGRSDVGYQRRVEYDTQYYFERTTSLDVKIMFKTIWVVLSAKGSC